MDLSSILNNVQPEENLTRTALPQGFYNVYIDDIEPKTTKSGGKALNFKLKVFGEKYNNYALFDFVNISVPTSEKATEIGLQRLKKISEITGSTNTEKMKGKKMTVFVGIERSEQYGDTNKVKSYDVFQGVDNTPTNNASKAVFTASEIPF
jgi:hypothetical protein